MWIHDKQVVLEENQVELIYFRRNFVLENIQELKLNIMVSADSRYRLYVNGFPVSHGPSKGDNHTHYYEEIDCSAYLHNGHNVIAAKVVHYNDKEGSVSVWRSSKGGFFLAGEVTDGEGNAIVNLKTDRSWLCLQETAITNVDSGMGTGLVGSTEKVDGRKLTYEWNAVSYDDEKWSCAVKVSNYEDALYGQLSPWNLTLRNIPQLFEQERGFKRVMKMNNQVIDEQTGSSRFQTPFTIGPNQSMKIELDAGEMTTGYPVLKLGKGKSARVKLLYAECYAKKDPVTGFPVKGIRDDATGELFGVYDLYEVGGYGSIDKHEEYEPFLFRTFRFVSLEVETADEELAVYSFSYRETGYPLDIISNFSSSDDSLQQLWNISINTLKRCMHETYEDCPYYEQLQYTMDTRLQALFTYQLNGDDRLARKAIHDFHSSRLPNGLLQSRYPSILPQVIPGFSLYWIMMVHDHYQYFGDVSLVRTYLPTIDGILEWFTQRIESNGLLGGMPSQYWSFVDWVEEWMDQRGVPTASQQGSNTIYNLMFITTLKLAAELQDALGRRDTGEEYRVRAAELILAVNRTSYSNHTGLYRDAPQAEEYSQHSQIWAVLAGAIEGESAKGLMERMLANKQLPEVSYAMSFFLFRALEKTGCYDRSFKLWDIWRGLTILGLTSWVEDPVKQRSDCHAWGAVPIFEFSASILGVKPAAPGFTKIKIAPQIGSLKQACGDVATPKGIVNVAWELNDQKNFNMLVSTRVEAGLEIILPDNSVYMYQGSGDYRLSCQM
ncbi:hypothetical protein AMS66_29850 [Paenibacillus xylanivorans]|uniref:Alpha-L-rhamnosidase n=1 Tax=Paenibacillus xylanivorans TaxID=1705561 RepID=A0A0M9BK13_9BACL|nr:hypothetical protein AMS66_29850 [Paenibacillus xylanivorans]